MEILYSTEVIAELWGGLTALAVIGAIITGFFGIVALFDDDLRVAGFITSLICVILIIAAVATYNVPEKITQHKVVISDMETFDTEKYEIVSTEGRIFTINERN